MEFRSILATVGTAMTAIGIGLVILSQPAFGAVNETENRLGWAFLALGVLLLLIALAWSIRAATRKIPQPSLVVECGNDGAFRQARGASPRHTQAGVDAPVRRVYQTRLVVRETSGVEARTVKVQVSRTDPPPDPEGLETLPATLRWTTELYSHDFTPGDRFNVILCELVEYHVPAWSYVHGHVPHVKQGETVTIDVQTFADLKPHAKQSFVVTWPEDAKYPTVEARP